MLLSEPRTTYAQMSNFINLFSIASHNISVHGKPTLNRGGGGEGRDIKHCEMSYFCGHIQLIWSMIVVYNHK